MTRKKKFRDPEIAAMDAYLKAEAEDGDFELFVDAYVRATGERLTAIDRPEPPDFRCVRGDDSEVGVELTQIMRSPDDVHWEQVLYRKIEMETWKAVDEFGRLVDQKSGKLLNFPTSENILLLQSCDANFGALCRFLLEIPLKEFEATGFQEIWLGDYQGVREGAHYAIELHGLFPEEVRIHVPRPDWDQKPFG